MPRTSWRRVYEGLLATFGERIADAFAEAVSDLRAGADLQRLVLAIERGDVLAAVQALNLDPVAYDRVLDEVKAAFTAAGQAAVVDLPRTNPAGEALVLRFGGRNLRAEAWLRQHGAEFVTQIIEDQRAAVRDRLVEGMVAGNNPRRTALEIIGRISRATGKRAGGILGLTQAQARYVSAARAELASADPAALRHYLTRGRRDKRFDRSVAKALREGRALEPGIAAKAGVAYERRLLQLRGEVIGRTESLRALNAGQFEALQQGVDAGKFSASQVRRTWRSAEDRRVRDTHEDLNGDTVGLTESFISPSGAVLRFPGDPAAPIAETAQCRCWTSVRISWGTNLR